MSARRAGRVRRRPTIRMVLPAVLLSFGSLAVAMGGTGTAAAQPARASRPAVAAAAAASTSGAFKQTETIERTNLINGQDQVVDKRTVSLSVNVTTNLVDHQTIQVSWTGAHPTGGIQTNPNDGNNAPYEEYPMVLLECQGKAAAIQPEDCWTTAPAERYFSTNDPFPPWRLDRYATADDQRNAVVNEPNPLPSSCTIYVAGAVRYWLPFVTPSGETYPVGPGECADTPNEMNNSGTLGDLPSNETYAATNTNGGGSADFDVWTNELNPDLGCSDTVPCALVAVPIMGISCDPAGTGMPVADQPTPGAQEEAAAAECEQTGYFTPGSVGSGSEDQQHSELTVSGQLWWAASNWRNRVVVPLTFAPPSNICSLVNQGNHFIQIYGSELVDQAMLQWQPHFCENTKLFTLQYAGISEPEAATALQQSEIEAALVTNQPSGGYAEPVVHAPVAATGFAISFVIDNANQQPVTTLRLDPRLLAKLLTESYPGLLVDETDPELEHTCTSADPPANHLSSTLCTNPLDITDDPEFQALNPGLPSTVQTEAASALLELSSQSDVMWALTSYINDNAAARAWLNGQPDPWGMTVNSAYKGIALPVSLWPLNSTYEPQSWITGTQVQNLCYQKSPAPLLPLIAAPTTDLPTIAEDIQFYLAQSDTSCSPSFNPDDPTTWTLGPLGAQGVGYRFMIGVTTIADAERYDLSTASLLTYANPDTPAAFTSSAGMTFVAPTKASLDSAASLFTADPSQDDWSFPYSLYQQDSTKVEQAYPGTMLVYADIPTKGLKAADAADYANFVRYVTTTGQSPGGGIGQLPDGYLPMTSADHLGAEAAYALSAASAIAAQKGAIPSLSPSTSTSGSGTTGSGSGTTGSGTTGSGTSGSGSSKASSGGKGTGTKTVPLNHSRPAASVGITPFSSFGVGSYVLIGVAALGVVMAVLAALLAALARGGRKPFRAGGPAVAGVIARIRGMRWS